MGIDDVLGSIGNAVDKINKWTSLIPPEAQPKPLLDIGGDGVSVRTPAEMLPAVAQGRGVPEMAGAMPATLEATMHGMRWLYANGVAQPISTVGLVGKMNRGKNSFFGGDYFNTAAWSKSWEAANHISPGQMFMMNPEEAQRAIESPLLYYKPPESYLPPGFDDLPEGEQQRILKEAGMPAMGNAYVEQKRGRSAWFSYGSGAIDFASVVFLDPTTRGLGAVSSARKVTGAVEGKWMPGVSQITKPKGGWSTADIDYAMRTSQVQRLKDGIWANRDNPQLLNNTALAQHSGMGPRFGATVSRLQSEQELDMFVRVGMGDVRAISDLRAVNKGAAARMKSDQSRLAAAGLMRGRYANNPHLQTLIDVEMRRLSERYSSDTAMVQRYDEILSQESLLDQLHISRWSLQRAEDRTIAQNQYLAGPARGAVSGAVRGRERAVTIRPGVGPVQIGRGQGVGLGAEGGRYRPTPIETGYTHTRLWGASDFFTGPVTVIRSLKNAHPAGYARIDIVDKDSLVELRAHLSRIPNIKEATRQKIINDYLKTTTETQRKDILENVGATGATKVAERYGLTREEGQEIYRLHTERKQGEIDNMQRYSAGRRPAAEVAAMREEQGLPSVPYETDPLSYIDTFLDTAGAVKVSPFTATRLMNGHTFQDLDALGKVLARHSSKIKTIRQAGGSARDAVESIADYSTYLWKFTTLFRLGYIPRILGDDLASQWARLGSAAMAMRVVKGAKNAFDNIGLVTAKGALRAREDTARAGAAYARDEIALLAPGIRKWEGRIGAETQMRARDVTRAQQRLARAETRLQNLDPNATPAQRSALQTFVQGKRNEVARTQERATQTPWPGRRQMLIDMQNQRDFMQRFHDLQTRAADDYLAQQQKAIQGNQAFEIDGQTFAAAFGGKEGEYFHAQVSADETVGNLLNTNKQIMQGNAERSFNHGAKPISATQDAKAHLDAWTHAINNQIMQDELSAMAVRGATVPEMVQWLKTNPKGMSYRARMPKMIQEEDFAQSAKYEVDQYLHSPELRMKALEPEGVTPAWLEKAFPNVVDRPDVHIGQVGQSQLRHANVVDRTVQTWFKWAATIPANRMSRHPLFNQLYEGHLKTITNQYRRQGIPTRSLTVEEVNQITSSSRQLALRDTRDLVFDIAHRSDAAAAMRFTSPFFAATSESFQRWGRVIADKPQLLGYAGNWYNAPAATGSMQDMDGNQIDQYGFTYIPEYPLGPDGRPDYSKKPTLVKRRVPKSERYIVTRVPGWFAKSWAGKAFNITEANGELKLSQNSINLVTQGDPWFNPGVGPIVSIPVNEWVQDKPKQAELARHLGVLPFGPQGGTLFGETPIGRAMAMASPKMVRDFLTSFDTSDDRYQQVKLQITQREMFLFEQKNDRPPTGKEIAAMTKRISEKTTDYWRFSALSAFLQPMATQRKDPYQFYRDQYNNLRNQNQLTADDEFLERYGESYFIFAQGTSKSEGVPPTMKAVELQRKYGDLIAATPELASLIIGPEGNGPFSREAYAYQLNNPLVPGGAEMTRSKLSADEAMTENQRRLGWAKYTARMNELTAKLNAAGFVSFEDEGAEDFKADKKAWTSLYAEPLYPDGTVNPYYNEEWSKDFFAQDLRKYDRMIPGLTTLARSELAKLPNRTDLVTLQQYLGGRQSLLAELNARKAAGEPSTLSANANADLRYQWRYFVDSLIESDTRFGDLHHRYLSRDMGIDLEEEEAEE